MNKIVGVFICVIICFFVFLGTSNAQVQISAQAGVAESFNLGESPVTPVFQGGFVAGNRIRFENSLIYNISNKIESGQGWYVAEKTNLLFFVSKNFFLDTGLDYKHRNGGDWTKITAFYKIGAGYENAGPNDSKNYLRMDLIKQFYYTLIDNDIWGTDFVYRADYRVSKKLGLKYEINPGFIRFTQEVPPADLFGYGSVERRMGFYVDFYVGLVYRFKN